MRYACQVWGLCDNYITHRILTLQKAALKLMTFNQPRAPSAPIFSDLKILNVFDLVKVLNIQFIHNFLNSELPEDTLNTFAFTKISHSHRTRGNALGLLVEPDFKTRTFGTHSLSKTSVTDWNNLQCQHPSINLSNTNRKQIKTLATQYFLNSYLN